MANVNLTIDGKAIIKLFPEDFDAKLRKEA